MTTISAMDSFGCIENEEAKTHVRFSAGTSLVKVKPCFSPNSSYVFVVADNAVKVYSTKTGECLHVLTNNKGPLEAVFVNPSNELQLITVSSDGTVCFWDYEDAVLIREIALDAFVIAAYPGSSCTNLFAITKEKEKVLLKEFMMDFSSKKKQTSRSLFEVSNSKMLVAFNKSVTLVAYVLDNMLYVKDVKSGFSVRHCISDNLTMTCLAWHPRDECVATGDSLGRIILWYNYFSRQLKPTRMTLHWHTLPVVDVSFTAAGSFLFSGGNECVMVKWRPGSDQKLFLPRLGMPICYITCSPDNSLVASSHVDNSILLISPNLEVQHCIQGLACNHHWEESSENPVPTGMLYAPHLEALVLNGRPGHLQFYSLNEEKQLYNLDITQQNYITRERSRTIFHLEVTKAAFDPTGHWLATVEQRDDKETSLEIRLKFWEYKDVDQKFSLCTTIEMPHWDVVNALLFRPLNGQRSQDAYVPMAFTTSNDKRVRTWILDEDKDDQDNKKIWTCQSVGFYRDLPSRCASISEDGSVLSVAFGHVLTLWLPEGNVLRSCLCHPRLNEDIRQVMFGRRECSHLITCTTNSSVTVWDMLSLSVLWCVQANITCLAGDPFSAMMAAFSDVGDGFIFRPSSPKPVLVHSKATSSKVIAAAYIPCPKRSSDKDWLENSQLYFLNFEQNLFTITSEEEELAADPKKGKVTLHNNVPMTPFGLLIAETRKSGVKKIEQTFHEIQGSASKKIVKMMLNTPCHVLPSPKELCSAYLSSMLKPLPSRIFGEEINQEDDNDSSLTKVQQNSNYESNEEDDDEYSKADISEISNSNNIIAPETQEDLSKIVVSCPELDEDCLKAIRKEDYSWLFTSPLFYSKV